jgi:diguanylate cyclase (GGDEF)-like protein
MTTTDDNGLESAPPRTGRSPREPRSIGIAAMVMGSLMAIASLAVSLLAYWALDLWPPDAQTAVAMFGLPVLLPLTLGTAVVFHLLRMSRSLHERTRDLEVEVERRLAAERQLEVLANVDDLTGLANRRAFFGHAGAVAGNRNSACVAVVDFDNFKLLNDTHGHGAGDEALRAFGAVVRKNLARDTFVGRLGGEEFGVIVTADACSEVVAHMNTLRRGIAGIRSTLTASIGVTDWDAGGDESIDAALARADIALYRAKQRGRDRVEFLPRSAHGEDPTASSDLAPVARRP